MAKLACLPMFGRKYKIKSGEHPINNRKLHTVDKQADNLPYCHVELSLSASFSENSMIEDGKFERSVGSEIVKVDQPKVNQLQVPLGEAEYEGEEERDSGEQNYVSVDCDFLEANILAPPGEKCEKVGQHYRSPESGPSCLTERTMSEVDVLVSDPGVLVEAALQSPCGVAFSEIKPLEENESCENRFSDCSLNSGLMDGNSTPSGRVMLQDRESLASDGKSPVLRRLCQQGFVTTRSEGSAPSGDEAAMFDMGAETGIMSVPQKKPWWKVALRAHRSISNFSKMQVPGSTLSSPRDKVALQQLGSYGSDGDDCGGIVSPAFAADAANSRTGESAFSSGDASGRGNPVQVEDVLPRIPSEIHEMFSTNASGISIVNTQWPDFLPSQLYETQGSSVPMFSARNRVEEWISNIDLASPAEDEFTDASPASGLIMAPLSLDPTEGSGVKHYRESGLSEISIQPDGSVDVDTALAVAAARSLHPLATVAHFSGVGLKIVPPLVVFNLKTINLSSNSIVRIPPGCFPKSVHHLDLSRNKIVAIEGFRELTRLRALNLSSNRISRIGHGLANSTSLRELYLGANKISEVEGLHRLLKLTILDLSHNKLTSSKALNQLAANYQSLQALNLVGNALSTNLGEEQLRKFVSGIAPRVTYLNKQPLKSVHAREAMVESVAKAALGPVLLHHPQRGNKSSSKMAKKVSGLHHSSTGLKRSTSAEPSRSVSYGNLASLRHRQGHGHHHHHREKNAGKEKRSAESSPSFQFEALGASSST